MWINLWSLGGNNEIAIQIESLCRFNKEHGTFRGNWYKELRMNL
jgi:hypothetical protein